MMQEVTDPPIADVSGAYIYLGTQVLDVFPQIGKPEKFGNERTEGEDP
jgi:hypothetical protein